MRAKEFINESGTLKPKPSEKSSMKNANTFPKMNQSTGSAYLGWRMGIAMAGAPEYPTKADNWIGGDPLISAYTKEEQDIINYAAKQVHGGKGQNWTGDRSKEVGDVNKTSIVAAPKKNKYGV